MIKYFCDKCGDEIIGKNGFNGSRLRTTIDFRHKGRQFADTKSFTVEIVTSLNSTANGGNFCKYCILDALYTLDDRKPQRLCKPPQIPDLPDLPDLPDRYDPKLDLSVSG